MQDLTTLSDDQLRQLHAQARGAPVPPVQPAPSPAPRRLPVPRVEPTPIQQAAEVRANNADARAAADQALQQQNAAITMARFQQEQQDRATGAAATESERKAASFLERAVGAQFEYSQLDGDPTQPGIQPMGPRSTVGSFMAENFPRLLNSLPSDIGNSSERQQSDAAQREFIAAILRYDSGAAIPDSEFQSSAQIYFPQPGDGPEVIAQKARARERAIDGLRGAAGRLVSNVPQPAADAAGQSANDPTGPVQLQTGLEAAFSSPPPTGNRLTNEQAQAYARFQAENRGRLTGDMINQFVRQYGFQIPNANVIADYVNRTGEPVVQFDYGAVDEQNNAALNAEIGQRQAAGLSGPDDASRLISNGFTLNLGDEASGLAGGVIDAISGGSFTQGYQRERDIARLQDQQARDRMGWTGTALEIGGSLLSARAPRFGPAAPVTVGQLTRDGAIIGGVAGFGSGEGAGNSLAMGTIGGAAGAAIGRFAGRYAGTPSQSQVQRNALLQDFQAQGVDPLPANIGGPNVNRLTSVAQQSPISGNRVIGAFERQQEQFGNAVTQTADNAGTALNSEAAGNVIRQAGERFIQRTSAVGGRLYERANRLAGDVRIVPQQALQTIDSEIARLSETRDINAPLIAELELFKASLSNANGLSIDGIRQARTIAGRAARTEALRSTDAQRSLGQVMQSISQDIEQGLVQAGRSNAAQAFRTADDFWRLRIEQIDQTLEPLIGRNRSGEQILSAVNNMTGDRGNAARLRQVLRGLDPQELGDIQATIVTRLGRARNGAQDATGEVFSPNTFLTNWNAMTPQARTALFPNGQLRDNLNQLARIAASVKETGRYANRSNTGGNIWTALMTGSGATGIAGVGTGSGTTTALGIGTLAASAGVQGLNGRLMTSPAFVRWLARAPRNATPQANAAYVQRLTQVAAADVAIAREARALQQYLGEVFAQSPSRAAASGQDEQNAR